MVHKINEHEMEVLRVCAGETVPGFAWGAWVTECLESLLGMGLVGYKMEGTTMVYGATKEGRALVEPMVQP